MSKPLCVDGYCGLGGWSEGFLAEGYECRGYDIEVHDYGTGGYPGELVLRDMRQVHGSELKDAACLVFSPPCQEYSYMAMPWSRSKQIARALCGKGDFPDGYDGSRTVEQLNDLFNTCFRIQSEACEAAGHYIPMVIENVRGAQKWMGRAKANYGSFYLWGDVGMVGRRVVAIREGKLLGHGVAPVKAQKRNPDGTAHGNGSWFAIADSKNRGANGDKVPGFRFDGSGGSFQSAAVARTEGMKTPAGNCSEIMWKNRPIARYAHPTPEEMERHAFTDGRKCDGSGWTEKGSLVSHNRLVSNQPSEGYKKSGMNWSNPTLRGQDFTRIAAKQKDSDAVKQPGIGGMHKNGKGDAWFQDGAAHHGSKSNSRKAASALIAKIPFALSQYIAQAFKPVSQ
jgi:hypothetical protein